MPRIHVTHIGPSLFLSSFSRLVCIKSDFFQRVQNPTRQFLQSIHNLHPKPLTNDQHIPSLPISPRTTNHHPLLPRHQPQLQQSNRALCFRSKIHRHDISLVHPIKLPIRLLNKSRIGEVFFPTGVPVTAQRIEYCDGEVGEGAAEGRLPCWRWGDCAGEEDSGGLSWRDWVGGVYGLRRHGCKTMFECADRYIRRL